MKIPDSWLPDNREFIVLGSIWDYAKEVQVFSHHIIF
jgi:hypothetical protein